MFADWTVVRGEGHRAMNGGLWFIVHSIVHITTCKQTDRQVQTYSQSHNMSQEATYTKKKHNNSKFCAQNKPQYVQFDFLLCRYSAHTWHTNIQKEEDTKHFGLGLTIDRKPTLQFYKPPLPPPPPSPHPAPLPPQPLPPVQIFCVMCKPQTERTQTFTRQFAAHTIKFHIF